MEDKDKGRAKIIGRNLESLLQQSGITIIGLTSAIGMSVNHLRTVEKGTASITKKTASKIATFFGISTATLLSEDPIILDDIQEISTIASFYRENENNSNFFTSTKGKKGATYFVKDMMENTFFFQEQREVYQVKQEMKKLYHLDFDSKELSQVLTRLTLSGELEKKLKYKSRATNLYQINRNGKEPDIT